MVPYLIDVNTSRYKWRRSLNRNSEAETVLGGQGHDTDISGLGPVHLLTYINEIRLEKFHD